MFLEIYIDLGVPLVGCLVLVVGYVLYRIWNATNDKNENQ